MGYKASVYVRELRATEQGERIERDLKAFLQLLATYCDERRRGLVYGDVKQWAADYDRSPRRVYEYLKEATALGLLEKEQPKRGGDLTFYFTKFYSSASATDDTQIEPPTATGRSVDGDPSQSTGHIVRPVAVASAAHRSQLGTNDARLPIGIPNKKSTDKNTDTVAPSSRRSSSVTPELQKVIDFWKTHLGLGSISATAAGELKRHVRDYGAQRVESCLVEMAANGIASHAYLKAMLANQVLRENTNGRRPDIPRPSTNGTGHAPNSRVSAESLESARRKDEDRQQQQAEWERRDSARRAAAAKPGTLDLFGSDPDARGSS